jgi:hypothetical protein
MSDLTQIQQQINNQNSNESTQKTRPDALQDEMLVDTMMEEASLLDTDLQGAVRSNPYSGSATDGVTSTDGTSKSGASIHLLGEALFGTEETSNAHIASAMNTLSQLVGEDLVQRAFETGGDLLVNEIRQSLLSMIEQGLNPGQFQQFQSSSVALESVMGGVNANAAFDIRNDEIASIKGVLDSGVVAYGAVHAEIWNQDNETILAFQNLTQSEAEDIQSELQEVNSDTISDTDRNRIKAMGVTAIEVEEVLVDFWEAAQNESYQVVEDEDLN